MDGIDFSKFLTVGGAYTYYPGCCHRGSREPENGVAVTGDDLLLWLGAIGAPIAVGLFAGTFLWRRCRFPKF